MAVANRNKQQGRSGREYWAQGARHLTLFSLGASVLLGVTPAMALESFPYDSSSRNRFDNCTLDLIQRKVAPADAAQACANALRPEDLRRCVVEIAASSQLAPQDIVNGCRQVRQPTELAGCFTDLRRSLANTSETDILNNCSSNLLPRRYAQCVRGVSRAPEISTTQALNDCNAGGLEPRELAPNFIPYTALPSEQLQVQPSNPDLLSPTPRLTSPVAPTPTQTSPTQPAKSAPLPQKY